MTEYTTGADLIKDVLRRAGEPQDSTSDFYLEAISYINRAYRGIWQGGGELDEDVNEEWEWLRSSTPLTLELEPGIEDGTISVTKDNTAATLSVDPSPVDVTGWFLKIEGEEDVFRVASIAAAAVTLDGPFTGDTGSGKNYMLFKLEYTLPATVMDLVGPFRVYGDSQTHVEISDTVTMETNWPLSSRPQGIPRAFAIIGERLIRFSHYPTPGTNKIRLDYDYDIFPSDLADSAAEPLLPLKYRHVIADWALFLVFLDKQDNRFEVVGKMARAGLRAMMKDNRNRDVQLGPNTLGQIYARPSNARRFPRTASGLRIPR